MPYANNIELPESIRRSLPDHAQDIYRAAFNHAFMAHAGDPRARGSRAPDRLGRGEAVLRESERSLG